MGFNARNKIFFCRSFLKFMERRSLSSDYFKNNFHTRRMLDLTKASPVLISRGCSFISTVQKHRNRVGISDDNGEFLYEDIYRRSLELAECINKMLMFEEKSSNWRICFLCPNGVSFVLATWACWLSGNVAVPMSNIQSRDTLEFIIAQSPCPLIITTKEYMERVSPIAKQNRQFLFVLDSAWRGDPVQAFDTKKALPLPLEDNFFTGDRAAVIFFTSGLSTGVPKSVTLSHSNVNYRIKAAAKAWQLQSEDNVLHALPLHQQYSVINSLLAPLHVGSKVVMLNKYDALTLWSNLLGIGLVKNSNPAPKINVFPSNPRVYSKMLTRYGEVFGSRKIREYVKTTCTRKIRMMASGMDSTPSSLLKKWKIATGHYIVDTYSTAELGTVLSGNLSKPHLIWNNSESCEKNCGRPLVGTEIRVVRFIDESRTKYDILTENEGSSSGTVGELLVRNEDGPITSKELLEDNWFSTGDIVRMRNGCIRVIGRIVKNSILRCRQAERRLSKHPGVFDCYAFGINYVHESIASPKVTLAAVLVLDPSLPKTVASNILDWCNETMRYEHVPIVFKTAPEIPLDCTGRVDKLRIAEYIFQDENKPNLFFEDTTL